MVDMWGNKFCFCDLVIMLGQIETLLRVYCHFAKVLSKPIAYDCECKKFPIFLFIASCVLLNSLSSIFSVLLPRDLRPMYNNYCTSTTTV